jgi:hypothetical protein
LKYEKMYRSFYGELENFNRARGIAGEPPINMVEFKKVKIS